MSLKQKQWIKSKKMLLLHQVEDGVMAHVLHVCLCVCVLYYTYGGNNCSSEEEGVAEIP